MDDIYKNIEEYNQNKKQKILIVIDDMVADMLGNNKLNPVVTEWFIRERKLNISLGFITQSYFVVPKNIRLNPTYLLRENFPYSHLFWSVFRCIRTEYGEIFRISLYSVWMRKNTDQNNSEYGNYLRSHYSVMKFPNKRELQEILFNHSVDIDFQDFMSLYKKCTGKPYSFLVIDTIL